MSVEHDLGALSGKLAALVAAERRAPAAPPGARVRVWSAIIAKLPPPGGDGGDGGGGDIGGGDLGGGGDAGAGAAGSAGAATAKAALPWIGGAAGATAAVVAVVLATRSPEPPATAPVVVVATYDAAVEPAPLPVAMPDVPDPVAPDPVTPRPRPPRPAVAGAPDDTVATAPSPDPEDVLIERARISLVRAHFDEAQKLLAEHEVRFPRGPMRGERELLYVRALLGSSDRPAAEARAAKLRAADPDNPSLPAIDAALAR